MSWLSVAWHWYSENSATVNPIATFLGAVGAFVTAASVAWAAVQNARTATRQAETARQRHEEQTKADQQRRVTESFFKATEQLASDKLEARLGGIYTLERISRESEDDYWPVMETLTAFVRERTHRTEAERNSKPFDQRVAERAYFLWENAGRPEGRSEETRTQAVEEEKLGEPPPTDVAAVLTVIKQGSKRSCKREQANDWCLSFCGAVLRRGDLSEAHLEGADLMYAHLDGAILSEAHLEGAWLIEAHLERAHLDNAHLEGAYLSGAYLERADLRGAHLEGANLGELDLRGRCTKHIRFLGAHLEGADLRGAYLEGTKLGGAHLESADLREARGVSEAQLREAFGDAATLLPEGTARPTHWPPVAA